MLVSGHDSSPTATWFNRDAVVKKLHVSCLDTLNRLEVKLRRLKARDDDEFAWLNSLSQTDKVLNSGRLVACMSRVMLDFSLSLACRSVCSTTPILTSIWTISCLSLVKLCRIFTTGAAHKHTSRDTYAHSQQESHYTPQFCTLMRDQFFHLRPSCCCLSPPSPASPFPAPHLSETQRKTSGRSYNVPVSNGQVRAAVTTNIF